MSTFFTSAQLLAEINTDPTGLGYAAMHTAGGDATIAAALNLVRSTITVFRNDVTPKEVIQSIAQADFTAAVQLSVSKLQLILLPGVVDATLANVRGSLQALFSGATQPTKDALVAVCSRLGSRAEQLWGTGVVVSPTDVANAYGRF